MAVEKTKKLVLWYTIKLDELYKAYEVAAKVSGRARLLKNVVEVENKEREKLFKQKDMIENLQQNFMNRYNGELKRAQEIEKEEEDKRKAVIEQLQERIKTVQ